jgi:hypothetical protein
MCRLSRRIDWQNLPWMALPMATDRLNLTQAFEEAGIPRDASEKLATAIFEAIGANVATKADLQTAAAAMRLDALQVKTDLRADIAGGHARISASIDHLQQQIEHVQRKLFIKLAAVIVLAAGIGIGAVIWRAALVAAVALHSS